MTLFIANCDDYDRETHCFESCRTGPDCIAVSSISHRQPQTLFYLRFCKKMHVKLLLKLFKTKICIDSLVLKEIPGPQSDSLGTANASAATLALDDYRSRARRLQPSSIHTYACGGTHMYTQEGPLSLSFCPGTDYVFLPTSLKDLVRRSRSRRSSTT